MSKLILIGWGLLATTSLLGQVSFLKLYGGSGIEEISTISETSDSGYLLAGRIVQDAKYAGYVIKTNGSGDVDWYKILTEAEGISLLGSARIENGDIIICGSVSPVAEDKGIFAARLANDGKVVWSKMLGSSVYEYPHSIAPTKDGGFVIAGRHCVTNGPVNIYVTKVDAMGVQQWEKIVKLTNSEEAYAICQTKDNGFIVTGSVGPWPMQKTLLLRMNSIGDVMWYKTIAGDPMESGNSILLTEDGGYIVAGGMRQIGSGSDESDAFVFRTDSEGNLIWKEYYPMKQQTTAYDIKRSIDGMCVIAGATFSEGKPELFPFVLKIDDNGDTLWTRIHEPAFGQARELVAHVDGNIAVAGSFSVWCGNPDGFLLKLDSLGRVCPSDEFVATNSCTSVPVNIMPASPSNYLINRQWELGDGTSVESIGPFRHKYLDTGFYSIHLTTTGKYGCIDTTKHIVEIFPEPVVCIEARTATCNSFEATFSYCGLDSIVNPYWTFGDGKVSHILNPTHVYKKAGCYDVKLTGTFPDNYCKKDLLVECMIEIHPKGNTEFIFKTDGMNLTFTDVSTNDPTQWFWDFGDGVFSFLQHPTHEYRNPGSYWVYLLTSDSLGCRDSAGRTVLIPDLLDGLGGSYGEEKMTFYPSPFSDFLKIDIVVYNNHLISDVGVRFFDLRGRLVRSEAILFGQELIIQRRDLPSGMYFVEVSGEDGIYGRKKVIAQ